MNLRTIMRNALTLALATVFVLLAATCLSGRPGG